MSAQHTPGPWGFAGNEVQKWIDHAAEGMTLAPIATAIHSADARLIAAAPDMLAALRRLLAAFETDAEIAPTMPIRISWETCGQAIDEARAAIAKAEGRS